MTFHACLAQEKAIEVSHAWCYKGMSAHYKIDTHEDKRDTFKIGISKYTLEYVVYQEILVYVLSVLDHIQ